MPSGRPVRGGKGGGGMDRERGGGGGGLPFCMVKPMGEAAEGLKGGFVSLFHVGKISSEAGIWKK